MRAIENSELEWYLDEDKATLSEVKVMSNEQAKQKNSQTFSAVDALINFELQTAITGDIRTET